MPNGRCRMHGSASTGAKTAGRAGTGAGRASDPWPAFSGLRGAPAADAGELRLSARHGGGRERGDA
nr:hypothetical protein [Methylobacterium sp. E-046]